MPDSLMSTHVAQKAEQEWATGLLPGLCWTASRALPYILSCWPMLSPLPDASAAHGSGGQGQNTGRAVVLIHGHRSWSWNKATVGVDAVGACQVP